MDQILHQTPLFASLDLEGASALRELLTEQVVLKGEVLFYEGEPGNDLFMILEGKIKLGHASADGRESLMAVLSSPNISPGPRTAMSDSRPSVDA